MLMIDKGNEWLEVYRDGSVWILRGMVNGIHVMQPFSNRKQAIKKLKSWK